MVAVNLFDSRLDHHIDDVGWALAVGADVPVVFFDARQRASVRDALVAVLREALKRDRPLSVGD